METDLEKTSPILNEHTNKFLLDIFHFCYTFSDTCTFNFQLTALQEAHEREIANYVTSVTPLREQLEVQQVSIAALQSQLNAAKEELAIVTVERDHLNSKLLNAPFNVACPNREGGSSLEVESLLKKVRN